MNEQTLLVLVLLNFNLDFKLEYRIRYFVFTIDAIQGKEV
jgi:hypothetical protein